MTGRGPYRVWLAAWTGITALAVTNGVSRSLYVRRLGETRAHQVSAVTLVAVALSYARLVQRRWPLPTAQAAARVGAAWVGMTVVFEFGFGHFVAKQSWSRLLSDYDLRRGRMWPLVLVAIGTAPALARVTPRRDIRRWGATDDEVRRQLPGDDAAPDARNVATYAITIDAPPQEVWPWIVQIGRGRAGFYTYTWIENLLGADIRNLDRVDPRLQTVRAGDRIWLTPENYLGRLPGQYWRVRSVEPEHSLVLEQRPPDNPAAGTWELAIEDAGSGQTRLLSRHRNLPPRSPVHAAAGAFWAAGAFVMERRMLSGIKDRAEKRA